MDDDVLILPVEPSDLADPEPVAEARPGGSGWWPGIAIVAVLVALFSLIRTDSEPRVADTPETTVPPVTTPVTTEAAVTVPPTEPKGPTFEPPLLGRVWNSDLVVVDADVVTFIDLASGETRTADLAESVVPPVAFYEDTIVYSNGRDLIRVTPGFARPRFVRADARNVVPLPGVPLAFHDTDSSSQAEVVVVGDSMGATTWLEPGAHPWAMWNGQILVATDQRIELVPLGESDPVFLAEGTVLAASGDAVLYRVCPGSDVGDQTGQEGLADSSADGPLLPVVDCDVMLLRRDGTLTPSVDLPDDTRAVSLAPLGNHVIYVTEQFPGSGVDVVFVATTDGLGEPVSVTAAATTDDGDWPMPLYAQDGSVVVVHGRGGEVLIDLEQVGFLGMEHVLGDLEGEIVGFVSIRHEAGITSPAELP